MKTTRIAGCRIQTRRGDDWLDLPISPDATAEIETEILDRNTLDAPDGYVAADGIEYRWGAEIEDAKGHLLDAMLADLGTARDM